MMGNVENATQLKTNIDTQMTLKIKHTFLRNAVS